MARHSVSAHHYKPRIKRIKVTKNCEKCGKPFDVIRVIHLKTGEVSIPGDEKRFDTRSCANGHPHTKEWKSNIGKGLKGKASWRKGKGELHPTRSCKDCGKTIQYDNKSGFCRKCLPKHLYENQQYRDNVSLRMKRKYANGELKGWMSRSKLSFPESFFIRVLTNNQLIQHCEINKRVSKRALGLNDSVGYFLDFFFAKKMIDLEIDGRQHLSDPERIKSDKIRDKALIKSGYKVYRIKWVNIKNDIGKKYMKEEIQKFLDFYNR
jgi:ribosomal protein S14